MQASKRARKQALSTKKPPTTALSIFGLLRQGLKRRAAFSAASKIIKTRCNNQNRRSRGSASRTRGGEEKKRNTLKDAGYRTAWTDMYIYTCIRTFNEDNSILSSFSPLLFLLSFSSFSLCYNGQENVIGTLSLCRCDLLGRCVTATFSSRTMYSGCHSPSCLYGRIHGKL